MRIVCVSARVVRKVFTHHVKFGNVEQYVKLRAKCMSRVCFLYSNYAMVLLFSVILTNCFIYLYVAKLHSSVQNMKN